MRQENLLAGYEAECKRCGACCGALGNEPCANLKRDMRGLYYCIDYDNRLGAQRTVTGKVFTCVPIREVVKKGLPYSGCGYGR